MKQLIETINQASGDALLAIFDTLNEDTISKEQKNEALKLLLDRIAFLYQKNSNTIRNKTTSLNMLQSLKSASSNSTFQENDMVPPIEQEEISVSNGVITFDLDCYIKRIEELVDENSIDLIGEILPDRTDPLYNVIMTEIAMSLSKLINEVIAKTAYSIDPNDLMQQKERNEWIQYGQALTNIRNAIIEHKNPTLEEGISSNADHINVLYYTNDSGSICPLKDLESISESYREELNTVINMIHTGTFSNENVKRLNLYGVNQYSSHNVRVIFERIEENSYIIIGMFVKKTQKNSVYSDWLKTRSEAYHSEKDAIEYMLTSPLREDYIGVCADIENNIFEVTKPKCKKKDGDSYE